MIVYGVRKKPESRYLLTRSHSFSDISGRKVELKEKFVQNDHGSTLIRHVSYEKICNDGSFRVEKVFQKVHVPYRKMSESSVLKNPNNSERETLSNNSENENVAKENTESLESLPCMKTGKNSGKLKCLCSFLLFPVLLAFLTFCVFHIFVLENRCEVMFDVQKVEDALKSNVFGQDKAIAKIVTALKDFVFQKNVRLHALLFSGATGVGKSFVASRISEHFPWVKNIQFIILPAFKDFDALTDLVKKRLSDCGDNLVIIDGVNIKTLNEAVAFLNVLHDHTVSVNHIRVLAIVVVNLQEGVEYLPDSGFEFYHKKLHLNEVELQKTLKPYNHNLNHIRFSMLKEEHLLECIKTFSSQQNIVLSDKIMNDIRETAIPLFGGCKGVISKIQLFANGAPNKS